MSLIIGSRLAALEINVRFPGSTFFTQERTTKRLGNTLFLYNVKEKIYLHSDRKKLRNVNIAKKQKQTHKKNKNKNNQTNKH